MEYRPLRAIISGGGTGGHIFPAISIADKLKELNPESEILFVGAEGKMEMEKVPAAGYEIVGLPMLWLSMMGWLGIQAARGLNHMLDTGRASVTQAAHSGTSTVSTAGRMAVTKGMGGGSKSVGRNPSQTTYISYGSK